MQAMFILFVLVIGTSIAAGQEDRSALGEPNTAVIDRNGKSVDATYNGFKYGSRAIPVNLDASNRDFVKGVADQRTKFLAGARNGVGSAQLGQHSGTIVAFDKGGDPSKLEDLQGGAVSAGEHRGNLIFNKNKEGARTLVDLEANNQAKIQGGLTGSDPEKFNEAFGENDRIRGQLDPITQSRSDGKGTIMFREKVKGSDDFYLYHINTDARTKLTDVQLSSSQGRDRKLSENDWDALFNKAEKWHCTASATQYGESKCRDQRGQEVGRVLTTKDKVQVFDKRGVPVSEATIIAQPKDRTFEAVVGKGLLSAKVTNLKEADCISEYGKSSGDIKIKKPFRFSYPHEDSLGRLRVAWPSCFTFGADIEVAPGVDIEGLALEFYVAVSPAGRLSCVDAATCGRKCYYCDICKNQHKLNLMRTSNSNMCNVTGVRTFSAEIEVCPPPGEFETSICSAFTKDLDYFTNKTKLGNGVFQVVVWQMPLNKEALRKEYLNKVNHPLLGRINKPLLWGEFLNEAGASDFISNLQSGGSQSEDEAMMEWYISNRRANNMKAAACYRQSLNYSYGGSKADASALIDIANTSGDNIFKKKCPEKTKSDAEQYKIHQENFEKEKAASGNKGGIFGGLFGGGGR